MAEIIKAFALWGRRVSKEHKPTFIFQPSLAYSPAGSAVIPSQPYSYGGGGPFTKLPPQFDLLWAYAVATLANFTARLGEAADVCAHNLSPAGKDASLTTISDLRRLKQTVPLTTCCYSKQRRRRETGWNSFILLT